ncbi:MAG: DUF6763 family protein [Woeseia sp.]
MAEEYPPIGSWYRHADGSLFEVVAVDEGDATIELQHYDGTIDEIDRDNWGGLLIESVGAPEDWSGAVDMDPEDSDGSRQSGMPAGWHDPLEFVDRAE